MGGQLVPSARLNPASVQHLLPSNIRANTLKRTVGRSTE